MKEKINGKIKWFKLEKGYGYILGYDNESYFFELIDCVNEDYCFKKNDEVTFIPNFQALLYATEVEKIGE